MAGEQITKVWIEPGCIVCDACETAAPDVFQVTDDTCVIRPEALSTEFTKPRSAAIVEAAEECPVDVIKYDAVGGAVATVDADAPIEAAEAAPAATAAPKSDAKKPAAEPAVAVVAAAPIPMAQDPDPALQALLRAARSRGGVATIADRRSAMGSAVEDWQKRAPRDLPPDAVHARLVETSQKVAKQGVTRREMVGGSALTIGWAAFFGAAGVTFGPAFARFMMPNVLEEPDPRVRVGDLQRYVDMAVGDVNEDYKPQGIWMIRLEDRIAALNIICTHLGCIPNWLPNDRKFKCPCHGSGYFQDGINFEGPTPRPLERFKMSVVEGVVVVDKSKKFQYELGQWDHPDSYIAV